MHFLWCFKLKVSFLIRSLLSPRVIDFALLLTHKKSDEEEATGLLARCYTTKTSKKQMKEPWKFKREILNQQKNKNNNGETKDKRRYNNCFFPSSTYNYYVKKIPNVLWMSNIQQMIVSVTKKVCVHFFASEKCSSFLANDVEFRCVLLVKQLKTEVDLLL